MLNFYPHVDNALLERLFTTAAAPNPPIEVAQVPYPPRPPVLGANAIWSYIASTSINDTNTTEYKLEL